MTHKRLMWDPLQLALLREAAIAGNSISAGLTALRKANYAHPGLYSHAFFSLSIGLERKLKLIYIMDFLLLHARHPSDNELKSFGHNIEKLFIHAQSIKNTRGYTTGDSIINKSSLEMSIIKFMTRFAVATRFYNLDFVTGSAKTKGYVDPIADWFNCVGRPILDKHLSTKQESKIKRNAEIIAGQRATQVVMHTAEDGSPLSDIYSASYQTGITEITRKYGTLYVARLCRYIYYILWHLRIDCHKAGIAVPHIDELFFPFMNDDNYFLSIKVFPPRSQ